MAPRKHLGGAVVTLIVLLAVAATLSMGPARQARAHASLVASSPANGAVLDTAPSTILLEFDEPVDTVDDAVRVFDRAGTRVDLGGATSDGRVVTAGLQAGLSDGPYLVSWQVVSRDGHPIRGSFSFSVGAPAALDPDLAAELVGERESTPWDVAGWATRFLAFLGTLLASGLAMLYCRLPALEKGGRALRPWIRVAAWVGVAGVLANVLVQGVRLTGGGMDALGRRDALEAALGQGGGPATVITALPLMALIMLAGPVGSGWWVPGTRSRFVIPVAIAAPAGFAFSGHTATSDPRWLVTASDAVHTTAAAVWLGGLLGLVVLLRAPAGEVSHQPHDPHRRAELVARFSGVAAVAVALVGASGLLVAWRIVGSWSALTSSGHGRTLLVKMVVVAVAVALGGWNRYRLVPTITSRATTKHDSDGQGAAQLLRRIVAAEVALVVTALGLTASLVVMPPGTTVRSGDRGSVSATTQRLATPDGAEVDMTVTVQPGRSGLNLVVVTLTEDLRPFDTATEVRLRLEQQSVRLGPLRLGAERVGPGRWHSETVELPVAGRWEVEVFVALQDEVVSTAVEVNLPP